VAIDDPGEILADLGGTDVEPIGFVVLGAVLRQLHHDDFVLLSIEEVRRVGAVGAEYLVDISDLVSRDGSRARLEATADVVDPDGIDACDDAVLGNEIVDVDDIAFLKVVGPAMDPGTVTLTIS
jgi:hypothetical protein